MDVVVTGMGLVSALGDLALTWKQLLDGQSGILIRQPFADLPKKPLALVQPQSSTLEDLTQRAIADALLDARISPPLLDCPVVVGSSRGNQAKWEALARGAKGEEGRDRERVQHLNRLSWLEIPWLETLPHAAAVMVARQIGTGAAVRSPMAACATGLWAIAQGYELIRAGEAERVIVGAVEAPITPLTLIGFERMGALARTGAYPFDRQREGLVLGEGAAVLVLESAELARQRSASVYGQILGAGLTADGYHRSAPQPDSAAAIAAVRQCLSRSHLSAAAIDYIHAHGTATRLNDQHEARLIQTLFPTGVAVGSTKGSTGHTLGASGALGAVFCLLAIKEQRLPPTVGLVHPEFDLDCVTSARTASVDRVLCVSFGFGGQNAAIALGRSTDYSTGSRVAG